jgi:hypothetical protein
MAFTAKNLTRADCVNIIAQLLYTSLNNEDTADLIMNVAEFFLERENEEIKTQFKRATDLLQQWQDADIIEDALIADTAQFLAEAEK